MHSAVLAKAGVGDAAKWTPHIVVAATRFEFEKPARLAMWIAQCGHESQGFLKLVENMNYSATGLRKTWPTRFPNEVIAAKYARKPEKIANYVYADRMGNGDEQSGDGWRYRGRGLLQLTGKDAYQDCSDYFGVDFVAQPELLSQPNWAALSSGWIWAIFKGCNPLADDHDLVAVTKRINGGLKGLEDRRERWERAKAALL